MAVKEFNCVHNQRRIQHTVVGFLAYKHITLICKDEFYRCVCKFMQEMGIFVIPKIGQKVASFTSGFSSVQHRRASTTIAYCACEYIGYNENIFSFCAQ